MVVSALKRNKEIWTALMYCAIIAFTELIFFTSANSSLDGFLPIFLGEIDLRLIFFPIAGIICLLKGEDKRAFSLSLMYAVGAVVLLIVNIVAFGAISGVLIVKFGISIVKALMLIVSCKSGKKAINMIFTAIYCLCAVANVFLMFNAGKAGAIWLTVLVAPTILLWLYGITPRQDRFTELYRSSSMFSIIRLMGVGACIVVGLMFIVIAITLLGDYAAYFSAVGIWAIVICSVLTWLCAYMLMNFSD